MSDYYISEIDKSDIRGNFKVDELLVKEGIRRDSSLDYTCGMFDCDGNLIATGSCFMNTLRCLAVSSAHQGENLMSDIMTHLNEIQFSRGNTHLFLYTKCNGAVYFHSLGFYEIVRIPNQLVFMENKKHGFSDYLQHLQEECSQTGRQTASIVMNANPFTLGHLALVKKAVSENDLLQLFLVSEDASLIPFGIRKKLAVQGCAGLKNICFHDSGPYIISNATFPSYFQKNSTAAITGHALLDAAVFSEIARALHISSRYVGEEPASLVTGIYNQILQEKLPERNIACRIVPRKRTVDGEIISASTVRLALKNGDCKKMKLLVPPSTAAYFESPEALPVIEKIRSAGNVIHY